GSAGPGAGGGWLPVDQPGVGGMVSTVVAGTSSSEARRCRTMATTPAAPPTAMSTANTIHSHSSRFPPSSASPAAAAWLVDGEVGAAELAPADGTTGASADLAADAPADPAAAPVTDPNADSNADPVPDPAEPVVEAGVDAPAAPDALAPVVGAAPT